MHLLGLLNFTNFIATAGYSAVFILCLLQSCCVPTSSELTMGFAGVLAAQGKLSLAGVIVVGVLGEVIGAYIAWAVGRYAGRAVVDRFGRYILLSHRDLDRAEAWYERHQRFGVFGSRLLPVIRNFVAMPAGIAEVPLARFGFLTAAGSLIWDGAWAGIGYGVGSHWHAIAKAFGDIGYVLGVAAVGVIAFGVYHRYRSYKEATVGARRRPLAPLPVAGTALLSRLPAPGPRRVELSNAPIAAWEAAVVAGGSGVLGQPLARARRGDPSSTPVAAWHAVAVRRRQEAEMAAKPLLEGDAGVESNGRLTAMLGALLLALLAVEGVTLLHISTLATVHVVVGMVLVPVVGLKVGSATWRFARYYLGSPAYRRKGPPPTALRLLGPFLVVSTVSVVGSGIALLLASTALRNELLAIHKVSFVLWFAAMIAHVLGHLVDVAHLAPRDFYRRTRHEVRGAGIRQWAIVSAVCIGILLATLVAPKVGPWLVGGRSAHRAAPTHTVAVRSSSSHRHT